jgi:plasmid stability protein
MSNLLIRNIDPGLLERLRARARAHGLSVSEEAQALLKRAFAEPTKQRKMGEALLALIPDEAKGDDLVFEIPCDVSLPPDFSDERF